MFNSTRQGDDALTRRQVTNLCGLKGSLVLEGRLLLPSFRRSMVGRGQNFHLYVFCGFIMYIHTGMFTRKLYIFFIGGGLLSCQCRIFFVHVYDIRCMCCFIRELDSCNESFEASMFLQTLKFGKIYILLSYHCRMYLMCLIICYRCCFI